MTDTKAGKSYRKEKGGCVEKSTLKADGRWWKEIGFQTFESCREMCSYNSKCVAFEYSNVKDNIGRAKCFEMHKARTPWIGNGFHDINKYDCYIKTKN